MNVIAAPWRQHEEAAIDPAAVAVGFFDKFTHASPSHAQAAIAPGRLHGSDRGQLTVIAMKFHQRADVDIGNTVAIGEAESLFVLDMARARFSRPPVMVSSPVSTSVTFHGSARR